MEGPDVTGTIEVFDTTRTIVDRRTVERKVLEHLKVWMIPYLASMERHHGLPKRSLETPKSWRIEPQFARRPEDTLPFVAVVSTGISPGKPPRRDGDGVVSAWWVVAIGAVVGASTDQAAKDLSGYYGAGIRMIMNQMPELGGWAAGVEWNDERYDDWPPVLERMISSCRLVFTIEIDDVMNVFEGYRDLWGVPTVPEDPYADPKPMPTITEKDIDIEKLH